MTSKDAGANDDAGNESGDDAADTETDAHMDVAIFYVKNDAECDCELLRY